MDASPLELRSIFRQAAGRKGTLLAQAFRRRSAHDAKCAPALFPNRTETARRIGVAVYDVGRPAGLDVRCNGLGGPLIAGRHYYRTRDLRSCTPRKRRQAIANG